MVSQDKRASLWLSFDTKRAKVLPLVTEFGASEGKRYNIHFFQVFTNRTRSNALRNNEISVISYFHSFIEKNVWKDSVTGDTS